MRHPAGLGSGDPCPSAVGHKGDRGSPLHTALVERFTFLPLGGLPQQTVFWNQSLAHRTQQVKGGWLLLVCHFLDALQAQKKRKNKYSMWFEHFRKKHQLKSL